MSIVDKNESSSGKTNAFKIGKLISCQSMSVMADVTIVSDRIVHRVITKHGDGFKEI